MVPIAVRAALTRDVKKVKFGCQRLFVSTNNIKRQLFGVGHFKSSTLAVYCCLLKEINLFIYSLIYNAIDTTAIIYFSQMI